MKKIFVGAVLLALLAVPLFAVSANEKWTICHATRSVAHPFTRIVVSSKSEGGHFDAQGNPLHGGDQLLEGEQDCPADPEITTRVNCDGWRVFADGKKVEEGRWTLPFELEVAFSVVLDERIREPENCLQIEPTPLPPTPTPPTLEVTCAGWRVKQDGETIEGAAWVDPFTLEVAFSVVLDQRIREPEDCLKVRGDVTLRIGGRCTEDGDSQEIGYVFSDGDFDGARLIITRSDGVEVANEGAGSGFFPARAADYSWQIIWFNGQTREVKDEGKFTVNKCDLPELTPTPPPGDCSNTGDNICPGDDDPPEHPATGADPSTIVPVITALSGFALMGIGGSILYMRRRGIS